ncbi:unnamed protein product [Closterium sp. NIES-65]|nr:unnamed protein product [Closterium sp. NIES-65]
MQAGASGPAQGSMLASPSSGSIQSLSHDPSRGNNNHVMMLIAALTSVLRLPRAGNAAPARARGGRALEGLAGAVEVVVEAVEVVGVVVGVVLGLVAAAPAVEAAEAMVVAEGAQAAEVAEEVEVEEEAEVEEAAEAAAAAAVVERVATLRRGVAQVVVRDSSSGVV